MSSQKGSVLGVWQHNCQGKGKNGKLSYSRPISFLENRMKSLQVIGAFWVVLFLLAPVSAMSVDQNCTMIIEFHDSRSPLSIPTDQIRSISFRPTFPTQTEPSEKVVPPVANPPQGNPLSSEQMKGRWYYTYDTTIDGKLVPAEGPIGVDVTPGNGSKFTARYSSLNYGSYSGELLKSGNRATVRLNYSDPPKNYTAVFNGELLDKDTIQGSYSDNKGKSYEWRWTRRP